MKKKRSKKEKELIEDIALGIINILSKSCKYLSIQKIKKKLDLPDAFIALFPKALDKLLTEKKIVKKRSSYCIAPIKKTIFEGTLKVHMRGFGFVFTGKTPDVFIKKEDLNGAIDQDIVKVKIHPIPSAKGIDGKVIEIVKRVRSTLVCTIIEVLQKGKKHLAFAPILGKENFIRVTSTIVLSRGDRILVKIESSKDKTMICSYQSTLASIDDASKDILVAATEYKLRKTFSQEALEEAQAFGEEVTDVECKKRKDLTKLTCITIDPKTAKDFDDAISLTKDKDGFELGVHIADVAHYVKSGSSLDQEAFLKGNSTYFPGQVIPMLPFELSSHLCSLKPHVKRLAVSVIMHFDLQGHFKKYEILRSVIESKKRFSYEEAFAILEKGNKSPYKELLTLMKELALLLKEKRIERGSFDFALPEAVVKVDNQGEPIGIIFHEYDISHQMIEEFMLKANETIAKHLAEKKKTVIYRIHEAPSQENMGNFVALARSLGFRVPSRPSNADIQALFDQSKETSLGQRISLQFIKSMKLAFYSADNIGHYGLALQHYCHFTSPIRRYSDLIASWLLFDEEKELDIRLISQACSEKERNSAQAENSVILLKKFRLLNKAWKEDRNRQYKALITSVKPFGLFFEVEDFYLEGFVHISSFASYMYFDPKNLLLESEYGNETFAIGNTILVELENVDLIQLTTSWELPSE